MIALASVPEALVVLVMFAGAVMCDAKVAEIVAGNSIRDGNWRYTGDREADKYRRIAALYQETGAQVASMLRDGEA